VALFALSRLLIPNGLNGLLGAGTRRFFIRRFLRLYPTESFSYLAGLTTVWKIHLRLFARHCLRRRTGTRKMVQGGPEPHRKLVT
jgi:hypothetical protein